MSECGIASGKQLCQILNLLAIEQLIFEAESGQVDLSSSCGDLQMRPVRGGGAALDISLDDDAISLAAGKEIHTGCYASTPTLEGAATAFRNAHGPLRLLLTGSLAF